MNCSGEPWNMKRKCTKWHLYGTKSWSRNWRALSEYCRLVSGTSDTSGHKVWHMETMGFGMGTMGRHAGHLPQQPLSTSMLCCHVNTTWPLTYSLSCGDLSLFYIGHFVPQDLHSVNPAEHAPISASMFSSHFSLIQHLQTTSILSAEHSEYFTPPLTKFFFFVKNYCRLHILLSNF